MLDQERETGCDASIQKVPSESPANRGASAGRDCEAGWGRARGSALLTLFQPDETPRPGAAVDGGRHPSSEQLLPRPRIV